MIICRPHLSPYFEQDFAIQEKALLCSLAKGLSFTEDFSKNVDILITDTHFIPKNYSLENVKLIIHPNSGFDNLLELKELKLQVPVVLGQVIRARAVATYILSSLFSYFSLPPRQLTWDPLRLWKRPSLHELSIQLIGFGHVGKLVASTLKDLCPKLSIYDPYQNHHELKLNEADVLICAAGLSPSSRKFFDFDKIKNFKPNLLIINPARGQLFDENSLIQFLKTHPESFAYLDVFNKEPAHFEEFPQNTSLSSHIAGVCDQLSFETLNFEVRILADFLSMNKVDFKILYSSVLLENDPAYI